MKLVVACIIAVTVSGCEKDKSSSGCDTISTGEGTANISSSKTNGTWVEVYCNDNSDRVAAYYASASAGCPAGKEVDDIMAYVAATCLD